MSLIIFFVVFCVLLLLIEILSIALKITGLELSKARFQVISILTHTGFTTRESELIVQHPTRRKIASALMIVSYVAQVTLITLLFDIIYSNKDSLFSVFAVAGIALLLIAFLTKSNRILHKFEMLTEKLLINKVKNTKESRIDKILNLSPEFSIYEIVVYSENPICNKTLRELKLKDCFIQILKIDRGFEVVDFPTADTIIHHGDRIIVYGKIESITKFIME